MTPSRIVIDPRLRWGTPLIEGTQTSVARVVALHTAGCSTAEILVHCPDVDEDDVEAALTWFRDEGAAGVGPRPPDPGERHPRITVDPDIQGGYPTITGSRITVDAVLGMWEHGCTIDEILEDFPGLAAQDVLAALAYDAEAGVGRA